MPAPDFHLATFRFYGELRDFLERGDSGCDRSYRFRGRPSVKDVIEAQGIPHPEVDLILINGRLVDFTAALLPGDRVSVFPLFRKLKESHSGSLRSPFPGVPRFVVDVNLGKLARMLRLMGFDTLYRNDYEDAEVAAISVVAERIVLTRDRRLLFQKSIVHGYWVRSDQADRQVVEVVGRFALAGHLRPFHRCTACNGLIRRVDKDVVWDQLEPKTKRYYDRFYRCEGCGKAYWKGSHHLGLLAKLDQAVESQ